MKFLQEIRPAMNVVTGYAPGAIQLGPRRLEGPVALSAEHVLHPWQTARLAELTFEHFAELLAWQPEIVLLGTGERQQFPTAALMGAMLSRRIGFEVMDSRAACRTYNVLVSEARAVVVALL